MANAFYNAALHDIPTGLDPWITGTIKCTLVNTSYVFDATHLTLADVSADILTGVSDQTLISKAVSTTGVVSAGSATFTGVTAAQTVKAIILYIDLGGGVTRLIAYFDTGTGLPLTTTGSDITIDWNGTPGTGTVYTVTG